MWFVYSILTFFFWGIADLYYKKGSCDSRSHLKTSFFVGIVMFMHATIFLIFNKVDINIFNILIYLPVSLSYIFSMVIGYAGLKYLNLGISSPIQNSSGVITAILFFMIFKEPITFLSMVGIIFIFIGVILLSINDTKYSKINFKQLSKFAIVFPLFYALLDGIGTFLDGIYLDYNSIISANEALIAYEYTFFIYAIIVYIFLKIKKEKFEFKNQIPKIKAAIYETIGQFFYVFAFSANAMLSSPIVSSYSILSILLGRFMLHEKLSKKQYIYISIIMLGIIILGITSC